MWRRLHTSDTTLRAAGLYLVGEKKKSVPFPLHMTDSPEVCTTGFVWVSVWVVTENLREEHFQTCLSPSVSPL